MARCCSASARCRSASAACRRDSVSYSKQPWVVEEGNLNEHWSAGSETGVAIDRVAIDRDEVSEGEAKEGE